MAQDSCAATAALPQVLNKIPCAVPARSPVQVLLRARQLGALEDSFSEGDDEEGGGSSGEEGEGGRRAHLHPGDCTIS